MVNREIGVSALVTSGSPVSVPREGGLSPEIVEPKKAKKSVASGVAKDLPFIEVTRVITLKPQRGTPGVNSAQVSENQTLNGRRGSVPPMSPHR